VGHTGLSEVFGADLSVWVFRYTGHYGAVYLDTDWLSFLWCARLFGKLCPAEQIGHGEHVSTPNTTVSIPGLMTKTVRGCPGLIAPLYAMDTILPIVEFGQRRACAFDPPGRFGAPLWRALDFFYALIGAILFAIAVVTLTGLLRED
jgi:hypothetical protein